jgi:4-alpha-glucanotransferase
MRLEKFLLQKYKKNVMIKTFIPFILFSKFPACNAYAHSHRLREVLRADACIAGHEPSWYMTGR